MLETILLLACIGGSNNSCIESGSAYVHYSGIDKVVEKIGKENPIVAHAVGAIGLYKERRVYFKLQGPWFYETKLNGSSDLINTAWWKKDF